MQWIISLFASHAIMWVAIGGGGLGPAIIWESPETSISHSPKTTI